MFLRKKTYANSGIFLGTSLFLGLILVIFITVHFVGNIKRGDPFLVPSKNVITPDRAVELFTKRWAKLYKMPSINDVLIGDSNFTPLDTEDFETSDGRLWTRVQMKIFGCQVEEGNGHHVWTLPLNEGEKAITGGRGRNKAGHIGMYDEKIRTYPLARPKDPLTKSVELASSISPEFGAEQLRFAIKKQRPLGLGEGVSSDDESIDPSSLTPRVPNQQKRRGGRKPG